MAVNVDPEDSDYESYAQPIPKTVLAGIASRSRQATEVPVDFVDEMELTKETTRQELPLIKVCSSTP
jgi:hypothetical protein